MIELVCSGPEEAESKWRELTEVDGRKKFAKNEAAFLALYAAAIVIRLTPTLLLLVGLSGCDSQREPAEPTARLKPIKSSHDAVADIRMWGGEVSFLTVSPDSPVFEVWCENYELTDAKVEDWMPWLRSLRALHLNSTGITDDGLLHLRGLTKLRTLDLSYTKVTDAGLVHLAGLKSLETLDLTATKVTDEGLLHLRSLPKLEVVGLWATEVTDAGLVNLRAPIRIDALINLLNVRDLKSRIAKSDRPLTVLEFGYTEITDAGMEYLKELTSLERVYLAETQVTDVGVEHLKRLTSLTNLDLKGTRVTDTGLWHLKRLTNLRTLNLIDTQITDAGLKHLTGMTKLERLYVDPEVTEDALPILKELPRLNAAIKALGGSVTIDENSPDRPVISVNLLFGVTDADLEHLKRLTSLKKLNLWGPEVTSAGLVHLKGLTSLEYLDLSDTGVTDSGLVHLKGLTSLEYLYLAGTDVTDSGLVHLTGITRLRHLNLVGTDVTDAGVKELREALPKCAVLAQSRIELQPARID